MRKSLSTVTKFSKESQLREPVARFAKGLGFSLQSIELPFYEYRIDLYGFSRKEDATIAVELKLNDWRRALLQTLLYQLCADWVYIAMPKHSVQRVDVSELESSGVGLIAVLNSGRCACVLPAKPHSEVRKTYRLSQINYLKETACG